MDHSKLEERAKHALAAESGRDNVITGLKGKGEAQHSGVSEPDLVPAVPAAFVEQAAALHTASRLCMAMAQAAEVSSPRLADPVQLLGDYRLWVLNEVRKQSDGGVIAVLAYTHHQKQAVGPAAVLAP